MVAVAIQRRRAFAPAPAEDSVCVFLAQFGQRADVQTEERVPVVVAAPRQPGSACFSRTQLALDVASHSLCLRRIAVNPALPFSLPIQGDAAPTYHDHDLCLGLISSAAQPGEPTLISACRVEHRPVGLPAARDRTRLVVQHAARRGQRGRFEIGAGGQRRFHSRVHVNDEGK